MENTPETNHSTPAGEPEPAPVAVSEELSDPAIPFTYASTQATNCAGCGEYKHTPLRVDLMDGYVCLTCIDKRLESLLEAEQGGSDGAAPLPLSDEQAAFESAVSAPPFEYSVDRFPDNARSAWPGNYRDIRVDLAWCMWQARAALAAAPVAYQWQSFLGNPSVIEPFWTEWDYCTKQQYERALATPDLQGRALCVCAAEVTRRLGRGSDGAVQAEPVAWISVRDSLPQDPTQRCLVYWGKSFGASLIGIATLSTPWGPPGYKKERQLLWHGHSGSHNDVTHWMPLPAAPEASTPTPGDAG